MATCEQPDSIEEERGLDTLTLFPTSTAGRGKREELGLQSTFLRLSVGDTEPGALPPSAHLPTPTI